MFVVHVITIRGAMQSKVFLVKIYRVFSSWNCQIYVDQSRNRIPCKFTDFGFLSDALIQTLSVRLFLIFILLILLILFFIFHLILLLRLINIEPNFAHTILISDFFNSCFNDDIIFIDRDIFHIIERNTKHFFVIHADELKLL